MQHVILKILLLWGLCLFFIDPPSVQGHVCLFVVQSSAFLATLVVEV